MVAAVVVVVVAVAGASVVICCMVVSTRAKYLKKNPASLIFLSFFLGADVRRENKYIPVQVRIVHPRVL